ncbi:MarR family transcriptional regulator [Bifidobacterium myosotis]|uniref:MarR family transcriptional regulator n=2 Tax=Bifidobacterium myosotis TaxID=1630166 RepID=A0A261FGA0_9BIFI|nr:MarR family transcriptional regulator [Bifidobacterium myosotis]
MKSMVNVSIKRIYDEPSPQDGYRILVDRLWPRGVSKERAALDLWMKAIAPSPELRRWFGHDPERFDEFAEQYRQELDANTEAVDELKRVCSEHDAVTLLYAAKDPIVNHAAVLREYLENDLPR